MSDFSAPLAFQPRRSLLSVPAINERALAKSRQLAADAIIYDLEDSVAPERKAEARGLLRALLSQAPAMMAETIIRINDPATEDGRNDLALVAALRPDAVLLPKVEHPETLRKTAEVLAGQGASLPLMAMIETPQGVLRAADIAEAGRLPSIGVAAFVLGLNDLRKATGVKPQAGRQVMLPWLMQVVLAARAHGLGVIDSVSNDFADLAAFESECHQGSLMGFDGKMLIHPAQIEPANRIFGPSPAEIARARAIIDAFAQPANAGLGVIAIEGEMVERLHLEQALRLDAYAILLEKRSARS